MRSGPERGLTGVARLVAAATARLDRGVIETMERRLAGARDRAVARGAGPGGARARLDELAARYAPAVAAPERMFPAPPPAALTEHPVGDGPHGARVTDLEFPSDYQPFSADYLDEFLGYAANLTARARRYRLPSAQPRPTVVCLHGWGGGAPWLEAHAFAAAYWLRHGLDVVLFELPFHGRRLPSGRARGSMFPGPHVVRTNEAFGQAIWDLRALAGALAERGHAVGALGMSLGGYTTALWASLDARLQFAVPWIPAVDLAELMWRHGDDSPARRRAAADGVDLDALRDALAVHAPLRRSPVIAAERRMIVAGRGDGITPPSQAERLWEHWGRGAIHWFPGGHLAQLGRAEALRAVRRRLDALDLPGRPARRAPAAEAP